MGTESNGKRRLTRRRVLKAGATALGGGTALLTGMPAAGAQNTQAPAVLTNTQTGRTFRGLVRHGSTLDVQQMRLLPTDPRQVVIRSTAVAPCYTIVRGALSTNPIQRAEVPNHCGFGVVEAVGAMVKRVQVGDRVLVAGTSQCGQCYQCLHGRPDYCQFTFFSNAPGVQAFPPFAQMLDGTPVYAQAGIGGMSEIMTAFEEYCVPLFTDVPAAQLTLLGDQLASGFAAGHADMRFEPGSDVVVFGAGPVGLGAVQAARVTGAGQVIVVDPIKYRRDFSMKLGATMTLDPNAAFRLVSAESALPVLHFTLAACAAFFVHHMFARRAERRVVAAAWTLCAALTFLFVARAGASRLVLDTIAAQISAEPRATLAHASSTHTFMIGAWFLVGAVFMASVWIWREPRQRLIALLGCVVVLLGMNGAAFKHFHATTPNALVFQKTPATLELASRGAAHRLLFLGAAPLPPRVAAMFGIESFANADGIGSARLERLRETFFVADEEGTGVHYATRRGLQLFGIDRVLEQDEWIGVDTWTGFAAENPAAEYLTRPLVPDAEVELDFAYPHERTSALRVEFETGGRPLLQNIELEVIDRLTGERLAQRVLSPDFQNPNRAPRVFGILQLPHLSDWKSRKLRLVVRSNDGVTASAWSLVARRDWTSVMNLGFWRRDGVRSLPVALRHPEFTGFACRQYGAGLRGSIVVDMTWNADAFREDGSLASYRVLALNEAAPVFRTVSHAVKAGDAETALTLLQHPAFDPARTVVLEDAALGTVAPETAANEPVELLARESRTVRLRTTRARPGWLVTSQPWYPGWRVSVNGVEKPLLRANYAFSAVALGAGASEITFEYDPWSIRLGAWLSCVALVAIGAWFLLSRGSGLSRPVGSA